MDIKTLNIHHLREQIGVVSQEPILFDATVEENIRYGQIREVSKADIEQAAKMANAHDFISKLPKVIKLLISLLFDSDNKVALGLQYKGGRKRDATIWRSEAKNRYR